MQPERSVSVSLSIAAGPESTLIEGAAPRGVDLADGDHHLSIDRVRLVVGRVVLREAGAAACGYDEGPGEACEMMERGPVLIDAPLDGSVRSLVAVLVRPRDYGALGLRLHVADRDEPNDSSLLALHGDFEAISLRVEGLWDGEPFIFERALEEEWWWNLEPAPIVAAGRTVNMTLRLDPSSWFRSEEGRLIDPRVVALDPATGAAVEARIRTSIVAFEDDDVDGIADSN